MNPERSLSSSNGHEWDKGIGPGDHPDRIVTRIVLGKLNPGDDEPPRLGEAQRQAIADHAETLTHLHLWHLEDLAELPALPTGLQCLDVRGCSNLRSLPPLPGDLEELVLWDCPAVTSAASPTADLPHLLDLSIRVPAPGVEHSTPTPGFTSDWISGLVAAAPALEALDLERLDLAGISRWPGQVVDLRLNHCRGIDLPLPPWPENLRRLELRNARFAEDHLRRFPKPPETLDYVDFTGLAALRALPASWTSAQTQGGSRPRTLFLHRSGVKKPPASEHGKRGENVAGRTWSYFEDVKLTGYGNVHRAKLLLLGNGGAGKTWLSQAILPQGDPRKAIEMGTTHGIQFFDWERESEDPFEVEIEGEERPVHLHLWDFGGQDIYHNAHSLFLGSGSVFLLLWHPEQDGCVAPVCEETGYPDRWRPLKYWVDLIDEACPGARIGIVCSRRESLTDDEESQLAEWVGAVRAANYFCIPSLPDAASEEETRWSHAQVRAWLAGQPGYRNLQTWLDESIGELVRSEGTGVPSYWEIAQEMVQSWFRNVPELGRHITQYKTLSPERFQQMLGQEIDTTLNKPDGAERFAKLKQANEAGTFDLSQEDRIPRTLEFLTHSGWLYWDRSLHDEEIIVGQQWALDAIYTILDRRPKTSIYGELVAAGGKFNRKDLEEWGWAASTADGTRRYAEAEQKLLLSFMEKMGVCFRLIQAEDSWWEEPVYLSPEHLPYGHADQIPEDVDLDRKLINLQRKFDAALHDCDPEEIRISCSTLHTGSWIPILRQFCEHFGPGADYVKNGFLVKNRESQTILIQASFREESLGGDIRIAVTGPGDAERLTSLREFVEKWLPDADAPVDQKPTLGGEAGGKSTQVKLFISYAWDEENHPEYHGLKLEEPVDEICDALKPFIESGKLDLFRDKVRLEPGADITAALKNVGTYGKVLVVHSEKYWKSFPCQWEFGEVVSSFGDDKIGMGKTRNNTFLFLEHPSSRINDDDDSGKKDYLDWWENQASCQWKDLIFEKDTKRLLSSLFDGKKDPKLFRNRAQRNITEEWAKLDGAYDLEKPWDRSRKDKIVAWLIERLDLEVQDKD